MKVLVIDGQGGGLGKQLVAAVKTCDPDIEIVAVGTNSTATNVMLKAGADQAATGENSVVTVCRSADVIMGPVGIVIADASAAKRILIPVNLCDNIVVGIENMSMGRRVECAVDALKGIMASEG